jgi:SlyX protein
MHVDGPHYGKARHTGSILTISPFFVDRGHRLGDHMPMDERLVDLEARLAFQERALQELNDVVVRQQQDIGRLTKELEALRTQVRSVMPALVAPQSEETPPPHY